MTTYNISTATAGLKYQLKQELNGGAVFVKNSVVAYRLTTGAFTEITDIDYPSKHTYAVTSITRTSNTATVTTTATNSLVTGDSVTIAGASEADYNGTYTITVTVAGSAFTYTVANSPSTPATGTITAVGGRTTVPGVVYLDGYMFVQDTTGKICNSDSLDSTAWGALNYITPEKEPDAAVAIAKSLNYLCAFKKWDTEFFADAGNPAPGSPLASVDSAYLKLGCATADSIIEFDGGIVFMSQRDGQQRSREVHVLNGLTPKKISTPEVERLLNADDLATCYALYLSTAGHQFYVLTLKTSAITIVYDFNNGYWYQWTMVTAQNAQSIGTGNLTSSSGVASCTLATHGFSDGDPVLIAGANQSPYNGTVNITYVNANTFTYTISGSPASPATGTITATGYTESYFAFVSYAQYNNLDLVLHETNGTIYSLSPTTYLDDGVPINYILRLPNWDGGNMLRKTVNSLRLVGDRVSGTAYIRYSDDDQQTYANYRPIDLSAQSAAHWRWKMTRRRTYDIRYTENTALGLEALEQDATQGE